MYSKVSWKSVAFVFLCSIVWLKLFDILSYRITDKWKMFFSYYEGYRLPASISGFVPFTIETIRHDSASSIIVFTGDSTSGGLLYHHSQAIPAYLNTALRASGWDAHTYNLAFSAAHLSEQYLLMKETLQYADIVIFPVHYSFFSGRGPNQSFIFHSDLIDVLDTPKEEDLVPLELLPVPYIDRKINAILNSQWYTYKVHRLLSYIILGKQTRFWIKDLVESTLRSSIDHQVTSQAVVDPTVPFSLQKPEVQEMIIDQNREFWQKVDFINSDNVNLQYLKKICDLKRTSNKRFLAYFVPLDIETLKRNQIFDELKYAQIIGTAKKVLDECTMPYIDFNQGNPANLNENDFYNPDHLLPFANQKAANVVAKKILHDI